MLQAFCRSSSFLWYKFQHGEEEVAELSRLLQRPLVLLQQHLEQSPRLQVTDVPQLTCMHGREKDNNELRSTPTAHTKTNVWRNKRMTLIVGKNIYHFYYTAIIFLSWNTIDQWGVSKIRLGKKVLIRPGKYVSGSYLRTVSEFELVPVIAPGCKQRNKLTAVNSATDNRPSFHHH